MAQKILVSGIQPSNHLTLGNYLGAIKNFVALQNQYQSYLFVADYHMLSTNNFDPKTLWNDGLEIIKYYLACGLNSQNCKIFFQSAVPAHLELCYLLLVNTSVGELSRMTQFKDKSQQVILKNKTQTIPTGLLIYPILMAADILMYDANLVPVGQDQKQHLELARNIAIRVNNKYNCSFFTIPEPYIMKVGSRIMNLQNPLVKMSKSNPSDKGTIFLSDSPEVAYQKIMQAKTDSFNQINYDKTNQPGISNLIEIYCGLENISIPDFVASMQNANYGTFKQKVATVVQQFLTKIQKEYAAQDNAALITMLAENHKHCQTVAYQKIKAMHQLYGLSQLQ